MGKSKEAVGVELPFIPTINETSRKLALRKFELLDTKGTPHFMLHTKCKPARELLEPIYPLESGKHIDIAEPFKAVTFQDQCELLGGADSFSTKVKKSSNGLLSMSKNEILPVAPLVLDQNVFTFHPKVSDASQRIAENLGSDFMSRQQKHLEKQKRLWDQATARHNFYISTLSPIGRSLSSKKLSDRLEATYTKDVFIKSRAATRSSTSKGGKRDGAELNGLRSQKLPVINLRRSSREGLAARAKNIDASRAVRLFLSIPNKENVIPELSEERYLADENETEVIVGNGMTNDAGREEKCSPEENTPSITQEKSTLSPSPIIPAEGSQKNDAHNLPNNMDCLEEEIPFEQVQENEVLTVEVQNALVVIQDTEPSIFEESKEKMIYEQDKTDQITSIIRGLRDLEQWNTDAAAEEKNEQSEKFLEDDDAESPTLHGSVDLNADCNQDSDVHGECVSSNQTVSNDPTSNKQLSPGLEKLSQGPYTAASTNQDIYKRHRSKVMKDNLGKSHSDTVEISDDKASSRSPLFQAMKVFFKENKHMLAFLSEKEKGLTNKKNSLAEKDAELQPKSDVLRSFAHMRSKTMPSMSKSKINRKVSTFGDGDRLRTAKDIVEKAVKLKKIFTIQGGYSTIRHILRKRGWVEKFYKVQAPVKLTPRTKRQRNSDEEDDDSVGSDNDDSDDDDDNGDDYGKDEQPKIPPWEEEDGIYGIMSRMVRNINPTFIWVLKRDTIDYRYLTKDQILNHYCKAGSFTTKVGLCINMRNVPWFENADPDTFYPRCFRLSHEEDRGAFIDDFRLTACMCIIKIISSQHRKTTYKTILEATEETKPERTSNDTDTLSLQDCAGSTTLQPTHAQLQTDASPAPGLPADKPLDSSPAVNNPGESVPVDHISLEPPKPVTSATKNVAVKKVSMPLKSLEIAIAQCEKFLCAKSHEDIDIQEEKNEMTEAEWDKLLQWSYLFAHEGGYISYVPHDILSECDSLVNRLKAKCPQFELDGTKNVWIVKPGAKSRGRGIMCFSKLEDMLKLVSAQVVQKEGKYVVQKYIERPLLIYNTKFDIRQWFLVTDWNPLTLWFYQDSYLRFCSQEFTLNDFDESIHLSNNAIQKNYKNGPRSDKLPAENMWSHVQFLDYLASRQLGNVWDDVIYPEMKKAVICSLLATQDIIEFRKSSFELYGADFMLTEDFQPWIIEINSSPSMESSTSVTARLCAAVLEDTLKVVLDRRLDRNCDIGRFELAYKQPLVTVPPYIGISLSVDGQGVRRPGVMRPSTDIPTRALTKPSSSLDKILEIKKPGTVGSISQSVSNNNSSSKEISSSWRVGKPLDTKFPFSVDYMKTFESCAEEELKGKGSVIGMVHCHQPGELGSYISREDSKSPVIANSARVDVENSGKLVDSAVVGPPLRVSVPSKILTHTSGLHHVITRRIVSKTSVYNNYPIPSSISDHGSKQLMAVSNVESTDLQTIKPVKGALSPVVAGAWGKTCSECGNGMNLRLSKINPKCKCQRDSIIVHLDKSRIKSATAGYLRNSKSPGNYSLHPPSSPFVVSSPVRDYIHSTLQSHSSVKPSTKLFNFNDCDVSLSSSLRKVVNSSSKSVSHPSTQSSISFKYGSYLPQFLTNSLYLDTSQVQSPLSITSQTFR